MRGIMKWIAIALGGLIVVLIIAVGVLFLTGRNRLANAPQVPLKTVAVPTDAESIARGEHLAQAISSCAECHAENLAGTVYIDDPAIGVIPATNLTAGAGGIGADYSDEDWAAAIRHGVAGNGRTLGIMPSNAYAHMDDTDLGALIAYLKSLPPVDNELPARQLSFPGTIIFGVFAYGDHAVSKIDHDNVGMVKPPEEPTPAYGEYLSLIAGCHDCHGADLTGRSPEEAQNGPPPGPNLTQSGELRAWSETDFYTAMREGVTPTGRQLDPKMMPWPYYNKLTDTELAAIWAYLTTLE